MNSFTILLKIVILTQMHCSFLYLCNHTLDSLKHRDAQAVRLVRAQLPGALLYSSGGEMNH